MISAPYVDDPVESTHEFVVMISDIRCKISRLSIVANHDAIFFVAIFGFGPLAGVPVGLKDLIDHAGRPTTAGSSFLEETATASATVVERIEAAGGVIVGRTGLHEFAFGFSSENAWWGPVRNPWDPRTSPGGSSGGSAAAVAARLTPVAVGMERLA